MIKGTHFTGFNRSTSKVSLGIGASNSIQGDDGRDEASNDGNDATNDGRQLSSNYVGLL